MSLVIKQLPSGKFISFHQSTLLQRIAGYHSRFPDYPELFLGCDTVIYGFWVIGNYYVNKNQYYGEYPHSYLDRICSMFPDIFERDKNRFYPHGRLSTRILHLFSGSLSPADDLGLTYDSVLRLDTPALHHGDAHKLSNDFLADQFVLIMADPPYSEEDANRYGTPMVNRNVVVRECAKVIMKNGFLVWLDQVHPMYRKDEWRVIARIGLQRSTNHRFRCVIIFQRK